MRKPSLEQRKKERDKQIAELERQIQQLEYQLRELKKELDPLEYVRVVGTGRYHDSDFVDIVKYVRTAHELRHVLRLGPKEFAPLGAGYGSDKWDYVEYGVNPDRAEKRFTIKQAEKITSFFGFMELYFNKRGKKRNARAVK